MGKKSSSFMKIHTSLLNFDDLGIVCKILNHRIRNKFIFKHEILTMKTQDIWVELNDLKSRILIQN